VERQGRPDLIHAQSGHWAGAAASRIATELSRPYVLTEHFTGFQRDAIFPWRWPLVEEGYRNAHRIAAVSRPLRRTLVEQGLASPSRIEVHPNLAPTSHFTLPPSGRPAPPPFRFVTVTRLIPQKNVDGLLRAFAQLIEDGDDARLVVVGDGPERGTLAHTSRRLGIDDWVSFRGRLDREAVRTALWNAHAFVLPSHHETFGVVLLEAMATGLPVVATRCGGPEDVVPPDTSRLVPRDDPDALADALREVLNDWSSFDADTIRAYTVDRYGPEPFVRRTRLLYRRALDRTV
jgi:glycosyltransferase involved in cell wall biosynthesis